MVLLVIASLSFSQIGAVLKKDDPVGKTQTKGIRYKEKMEEIKDGEKAPPQPSWTFYPRNKFLTESPVEIEKEPADIPPSYLPGPNDAIPEDLSEEVGEETFEFRGDSPAREDSSLDNGEEEDWWGEGESSDGPSLEEESAEMTQMEENEG